MSLFFSPAIPRTCILAVTVLSLASSAAAAEVVAFWAFPESYLFDDAETKFDFAATVDSTVSGNANLQAFLGNPDDLDSNGGGSSFDYTSPTSGVTYSAGRTLKWDDLKTGGPDFDIDGTATFLVDKNNGSGPQLDDFSNDALMYIKLDTTGFEDLKIRFDIEGTPGDLPETFDIFYRTGGSGTWFRESTANNIPLTFEDYPVADPDNQFADSGLIDLAAAISNQGTVELILNDFAEEGNDEMEIDNVELIGTSITAVPEPTSMGMLALIGGTVAIGRRRRMRRLG